MSNTEFVMVPRELSERAVDAFASIGMHDELDQLNEILDKPAEQHQGEPVAWRAAGNPFFRRADAEDRAGSDPVTALYTRADPGCVYRLKAQVDTLTEWYANSLNLIAERDALLARVVNSGALSSEKHEELEAYCCAVVDVVHQVKRQALRDHLSKCASLEPTEECAHSYANTQGCPECGVAFAEQSSPVEIDERAEYEAWMRRTQVGERGSWESWQARAALERKL